jgi:hypothetical protein
MLKNLLATIGAVTVVYAAIGALVVANEIREDDGLFGITPVEAVGAALVWPFKFLEPNFEE